MGEESTATPRPWTIEVETEGGDGLTITIPQIRRRLHDWEWADAEEWDRDLANADLIVEAVNSYDDLQARVTTFTKRTGVLFSRNVKQTPATWRVLL